MTATNRLKLYSGYEVWIEALRQELTEAGRLEGLPTIESNQRRIKWLQQREREACEAVYLVPPLETPIEYDEPYPFGTPSSLPAVMCIATFKSFGPSPIQGSKLVVIWFQDQYAFPIDASVEKQLLELDWERLALTYEL